MSTPGTPTLEAVAEALRQLGGPLREAEAVGLFGSILWPRFNETSDLDMFVVLSEEDFSEETMARWERLIRPPLQRRFGRDVDIRFYTVRALKKVPAWYELLLASDHYLIYDKGQVAEVFRRIVAEAERVGLVRVWTKRGYPLWKMGRPMRFGETITVEVRDDDEPSGE